MYAIFLNGNHAWGYLDLNQPHEPFELEHVVVEKLPDELVNLPQGYICTYEDGVFGLEKLPEQPKSETEVLQQEVAELWYDSMLKDTKLTVHETEIATLWYEFMMGGM